MTIQAQTEAAVQAIAEILTVINEISTLQSSIASAVEQQSVATAEINKSISSAEEHTMDIASRLMALNMLSTHTSEQVSEALNVVAEIGEGAQRLTLASADLSA